MKDKIRNTAEFLLETGLLFEINRQVLHPFGLALSVEVECEEFEDEIKIKFGRMVDCRDDPEGLIYDKDSFEIGYTKFQKFIKEFGEKQLESRKEKLGYVVQNKENI